MQALFTVLLAFLATEIPPLTGRVVDLAGLLSTGQHQELDRRLAREEEQTSVQIVVAIIPSLEGEPLEDFAIRLGDAWRIGQKGLDNGAIILVVKDERRVRIEVGYGLEPVIPDGMAGRIIRERMTPQFREGNYYAGIDAAIDGLALAAREEYPPGAQTGESKPPSKGPRIVGGFFFAGFGWLIISTILRGIKLRPWLAAAVSGALALPLFAFFCGWLNWLTVFVFAPIGFLLGALIGRHMRFSSKSRSKTPSTSSPKKETSRSTTTSSSTSSNSDSFKGGGGKFGGGGASGRW